MNEDSLAALLREVANGEVWLEDNGRTVLTNREHFGVSDWIADLTDDVAEAEAAGLITRPAPGRLMWDLTKRGEAVLAAPVGVDVSQ